MGSKTSLSFRGVVFSLLENERFFVFLVRPCEFRTNFQFVQFCFFHEKKKINNFHLGKKEKKQNSPGLFHTLKEKSTRRISKSSLFDRFITVYCRLEYT